MTDTTREAVNLTGLDDYLRDPSVGLPWDIRIRIADALRLQQAEIARLTAESDAKAEARDMMGRLWEIEKSRAEKAEADRDAALAQVVQAATLPSRYGAARIQTVQRDFNALRAAIRAHDSEAAETAWDRCERWLGLWPLEQTTPPAPAPSTPVDNKISADPVGKEG